MPVVRPVLAPGRERVVAAEVGDGVVDAPDHHVLVVREDRVALLRGVSLGSRRLGVDEHVGPPLPGLPLGVDRASKLLEAGVVVAGRRDEAVVVPEEVVLAGHLPGQFLEAGRAAGSLTGASLYDAATSRWKTPPL